MVYSLEQYRKEQADAAEDAFRHVSEVIDNNLEIHGGYEYEVSTESDMVNKMIEKAYRAAGWQVERTTSDGKAIIVIRVPDDVESD